MRQIDARGIHYRELNRLIREVVADGEREIWLINVQGQRYLADGITSNGLRIDIWGVPGQDLAAFMNGPIVIVHGNAQDGVGNTMGSGKVVVHGMAGDVLGYGMRGGKLHILGDVGYRVGIHMKSYRELKPLIIVGGRAGDFFGEYMAGGVLILLGRGPRDGRPLVGDYLGTGMHGGEIFIRGEVDPDQLGAEVGVVPLGEEDRLCLEEYLREYAEDFSLDVRELLEGEFTKLIPVSHRPYGNLYAY